MILDGEGKQDIKHLALGSWKKNENGNIWICEVWTKQSVKYVALGLRKKNGNKNIRMEELNKTLIN